MSGHAGDREGRPGTGSPSTSSQGADRRPAGTRGKLKPVCVHCLRRFPSLGDLQSHITFECEALGRQGKEQEQ